MAKAETEFKRWWLRNWSGWSETYEPRRGAGVGIPDVQVAINGRIVPLEFKTGQTDGHCNLWIDEVRPDQIGWHMRAHLAGIKTFFIIGEKYEGLWYAYVVEGHKIAGWKDGIPFDLIQASEKPDDLVGRIK